MEKVQTITRAKVPIVKFIDPRSGLNVDISINNSLALYNTDCYLHTPNGQASEGSCNLC